MAVDAAPLIHNDVSVVVADSLICATSPATAVMWAPIAATRIGIGFTGPRLDDGGQMSMSKPRSRSTYRMLCAATDGPCHVASHDAAFVIGRTAAVSSRITQQASVAVS